MKDKSIQPRGENNPSELDKCKNDPVYWFQKYGRIDGNPPPPLTEIEKSVLDGYMRGAGIIYLKRRTIKP